MVLRYSEQTIEEIFSSKEFVNCFEEHYSNKNKDQLISFLNNIETNKKYYKMGIQKNKRYKRVENDDTVCIKKINSLINKLTNETCDNIIKEIMPLLKSQILSYIIENIIEKSLMHHIYIDLYVKLIYNIGKNFNIYILLNKEIETKYTKLLNFKIEGETYDDLCNKNNNLDKMSGLSILITHLEKENKINNGSQKIIDDLIQKINYNDLDNLFKIIVCIYNIFKINTSLKEKYKDKLNEIKNSKINSRIKFKIMDILDI
jgi:hypothetical protein